MISKVGRERLGCLGIVPGETGSGKSVLLFEIAKNYLDTGRKVMYFSVVNPAIDSMEKVTSVLLHEGSPQKLVEQSVNTIISNKDSYDLFIIDFSGGLSGSGKYLLRSLKKITEDIGKDIFITSQEKSELYDIADVVLYPNRGALTLDIPKDSKFKISELL